MKVVYTLIFFVDTLIIGGLILSLLTVKERYADIARWRRLLLGFALGLAITLMILLVWDYIQLWPAFADN
jgi:hypothetical protein